MVTLQAGHARFIACLAYVLASTVSFVFMQGDMAAAAPSHEFIFQPTEYGSEWWELPDSSWRQVLRWTAIPGLAIALAVWFTLPEPRVQPSSAPAPVQASTSAAATLLTAAASSTTSSSIDTHASKEATASVVAAPAEPSTGSSVLALLRSKGFMGTTLAAALNDLGSYALIAWQSIFLERVYHLDSSYYAPILAILLPVGGIIGGVGGGSLADKLAKKGQRAWVTGGATMLAAPFLLISCLAPTPTMSFAALLVGFALSEAWRAPAAVMAR